MKSFSFIPFILIILFSFSCNGNKNVDMQQEEQIKEELKKVTALLQDSAYAREIAGKLEAAYYLSQGQTAPPFIPAGTGTATVEKRLSDEKIATNIAAFYAVECGIGALMEKKGGNPVEWLKKIVDDKTDSTEKLLLNRFANATWKAGQPFRGLERIKRDVFVSPVFLPQDEIKKDDDQVKAAATKLLAALNDVKNSSSESQLQKMSQLLQDKEFALEIAKHMEAAYYTAQQQEIPPFLKPGEDSLTIKKSLKEEKIATSIAGFYALECGLSYLATAQQQLPSKVLTSILNGSISSDNKKLFHRFANATWKAGQPFRGLDRITRETFTCFDLLPPVEVEKDWVQVKAAAEELHKKLK